MTERPPLALSMDDSCSRIYINGLHDEGKRVSVCLDHAELQKVVAYNIEEGWVETQIVDEYGRPFVSFGRVATQRHRGNVTVSVVDL